MTGAIITQPRALAKAYGAAAVHLDVPPKERSALWRDRAARQGQTAFRAPNPQERETLAQEALVFSPILRSTDPWVLTAGGPDLWTAT